MSQYDTMRPFIINVVVCVKSVIVRIGVETNDNTEPQEYEKIELSVDGSEYFTEDIVEDDNLGKYFGTGLGQGLHTVKIRGNIGKLSFRDCRDYSKRQE